MLEVESERARRVSAKQDIADRVFELNLAFPVIAQRVLDNIYADREVYQGFDSQVHQVLSKHQVPMILDHLQSMNVIFKSRGRRCGFDLRHKDVLMANLKTKTPAQRSQYFRQNAELMADKIADGASNKMAVVNLTMDSEGLKSLHDEIWPIIKKFANNEEPANGVAVNFMFCSVAEESVSEVASSH